MRVICPHCLSKAIITSTNRLSEQVTDLYCHCTNGVKCGATFVSTLAYKHVINQPMQTTTAMAMELVNRLSKEEKEELQRAMVR